MDNNDAKSLRQRSHNLLMGKAINTMLLKVFLAIGCLFFAMAGSALGAGTYTLGVVPQFEQRQLHTIWEPIAAEVGRRAGVTIKVVSSTKMKDFEKQFQEGAYDFLFNNPYQMVIANERQKYAPLIRDKFPLKGILVVRQDSPLQSPADLAGKTVAFPSPNALGASLLMRADLERIFKVKVTPLYVHTHNAVYLHVLKDMAAAGGGVAKTLQEQLPAVQEGLRILYTTREMPSHPVSAHPRVPQADRDAVRRAFQEMGADPAGRALLAKIPMREVTATTMEDYLPLRDWGLNAFYDATSEE